MGGFLNDGRIYCCFEKTDLVAEPLMLQFYDIDKSPEESHPRVGFRLNTQVKADFYSYLDKTISLTVLEKCNTS